MTSRYHDDHAPQPPAFRELSEQEKLDQAIIGIGHYQGHKDAMTDKHLAVSLEHQADQSRTIKKLEAENSRLRATLAGLPEVLERAAEKLGNYATRLYEPDLISDLAAQLRDFAQRINQGKTT